MEDKERVDELKETLRNTDSRLTVANVVATLKKGVVMAGDGVDATVDFVCDMVGDDEETEIITFRLGESGLNIKDASGMIMGGRGSELPELPDYAHGVIMRHAIKCKRWKRNAKVGATLIGIYMVLTVIF